MFVSHLFCKLFSVNFFLHAMVYCIEILLSVEEKEKDDDDEEEEEDDEPKDKTVIETNSFLKKNLNWFRN